MIFALFCLFVTLLLWYFKKEMNKKMQYQEFIDDAKDGVLKNFESNFTYAHASTKGIRLIKNEDNKYRIVSQSKLHDTSVIY